MTIKEKIIQSIVPNFAPHSLEVARRRYMKNDENGKAIETPAEMFYRVAEFIASADAKYGAKEEDLAKTTSIFYKMLATHRFYPGGRALYEAGNRHTGQLSSCFVLPIDDTLEGIFTCLKNAAIVQKNNGGTGFNFSPIRQKGAAVNGIVGVAAGPIHYIKTFDQAFSQLLQGSKRHGGNMGILNVDHPDILEFIRLKGNGSSVKNFNLSVGVTDDFMERVRNDEKYDLVAPDTKKVVKRLRARYVFDEIVKRAWQCADPGLIFLDEIERKNPTPKLFRIIATNPCGEEPLGPNESCNLASIILPNHIKNGKIDWDRLEETVKIAIHFLDNMIDKSEFPLKEIQDAVELTRKVGLGILGFGQMLFKLNIPYNSEEAVSLCEKIMRFVEEKSIEASVALASVRGVFPAFYDSVWKKKGIKLRNATLTSIAPTGTISILANSTSGIEPCFSLVMQRRMFYEQNGNNSAGTTAVVIDPVFEEVSKRRGFYSEKLIKRILQEGSIQNIDEIPQDVKDVFVTSHDISYDWHIKMQAAAQKWTDAAVSKTINFPHSATVEDVYRAYTMAYDLGCKGITIYRDGCKQEQVLSTGKGSKRDQVSYQKQTFEEYLRVNKDDEVQNVMEKDIVSQTKTVVSRKVPIEPVLTQNAITVLEKRALKRDENGNIIESPDELFHRVANTIASAEDYYNTDAQQKQEIEERFYKMMSRLEFIPGQAIRNASSKSLTLSACLVLPIEDSIESIMQTLRENVVAHKATCGTGINYSHIRPKGSQVNAVGPIAAGPVEFMRAISVAQKTVQTKGSRAQGSMGILNIDHPDIEEFIACKDRDDGSFDNMNISVGITDAFMSALDKGEEYDLIDPHTGKVVCRKNAKEIFNSIAEHAWKTGDPGIIFIDRIDRDNPTPSLGKIESTNVCGEQPLLPYETCNLGSIVLSRMLKVEDGKIVVDWDKLARTIYYAVRFLDNTIDLNKYPLKKIEEMSKKTRRIGLGVMGFADALILMNIPYNSEMAVQMAERIMKFVQENAWKASQEIAKEKGSFPVFSESIWKKRGFECMRNSAVTTIAPTGYTSIVANCSSGIEPVFALAYRRENSMGGIDQIEVHQEFKRVAHERGFYSEEMMEQVLEHGSVQDIDGIPEDIKRVFVVSYDISPEWHIKIQAAFQKYTDNAVSKTINFPNNATKEDILKAYKMAYEAGCKGVTIYRDGSKSEQVLSVGTKGSSRKKVAADKELSLSEKTGSDSGFEMGSRFLPRLQKLPRPDLVHGTTYKIKTGYGDLFITINHDNTGRMFEVFAAIGKAGGVFSAKSEAICRLISLGLRSGIDPQDIIEQLKGIRGPMPIWGRKGMVLSIPDAIAQVMADHIQNQKPQLAIDFDKASASTKDEKTDDVIKTEIKEIRDTELEKVEMAPPKEELKISTEDEDMDVLQKHTASKAQISVADRGFSPECPECQNILEFSEGCMTCRACGFSKCG